MKIAVSACLCGEACRYDGQAKECAAVNALAKEHELVPICPEVLGGLPVPRPRCELVAGAPGEGMSRVIDETGADKTDAFAAGAQKAWEIARGEGCELAVLKAKSPSCGTGLVYDGTFSGRLVPGYGITARLFREGSMRVIDEEEFARLVAAKGI